MACNREKCHLSYLYIHDAFKMFARKHCNKFSNEQILNFSHCVKTEEGGEIAVQIVAQK
jgi:hypothetical protein